MADGPDPTHTSIRRPEGYSDAEWNAYKAGAAAMASYLAQMTLSVAEATADGAAPDREPPSGSGGNESGDARPAGDQRGDAGGGGGRGWPEECPCGGEVRYEVGSETGVCRSCGRRFGGDH